MVYFLLFIVGCTLVGFGVYFVHYLAKEQQQQKEQREKDDKQQAENFRRALLHAIQASPRSFNYLSFLSQTGYPAVKAREIADDLYARVFGRAISDGIISNDERGQLDRFSVAIQLSPSRRTEIESRIKQEKYRDKLDKSLGDGQVSQAELYELNQLRRSLGMTTQEIAAASGTTSREAYRAHFRQVIRKGSITEADVGYLAHLRNASGISDHHAFELVRGDALRLYHQRFSELKQDGNITPEDEAELDCLQRFLSIPQAEVMAAKHEIERIKYRCRILGGDLPRIQTRKLLEGGEVCHLDCQCYYQYETRTNTLGAEGMLTVTNQRILFTSTTKSFEFRAAKVVNIEPHSNAVCLQTSGSKGSGRYFLEEADLVAAIIEGVVRKHKYLATESFSSALSRHIPDLVKQEVWARDNGQCVKCKAADYLEFDHIIPHSKGGASSTNNVQLLCRRCNSVKADRIG